MNKLPEYIRKTLFLFGFSVVSAVLYIIVSLILFDYLSSQTRLGKIKDAIEKSERFTSVDQDINLERALSINLHLNYVGIFDKYCHPIYVNDLSLNHQSCIRKSDLYFWFSHPTGHSEYIISFSKEGGLKDFFKENLYLIVISCFVYIILNSLLIVFIFFIFVVLPATALSAEVDDIVHKGIEHLTDRSRKNPFLSGLYKSVTNLVYNYSEFKKKEAILDISLQIAHDIRSPIEILKGVNLNSSDIDKEHKERFNLGLKRIQEISNNLLDIRRSESKVSESENLLFGIHSIVYEKKIEYENRSTEILLSYSPEVSSISISMPIMELKRIISNLINNSLEAFVEYGVVQTNLSLDKDVVLIDITDNGPGFSEKLKKSIFSKGLTTKKDGNGLGLFMAKKNIENFGGQISYSRENNKTRFRIAFPVLSRNLKVKTEINISLYDNIFYIGREISYQSLSMRISDYGFDLHRLISIDELKSNEKYKGRNLVFIHHDLDDEKFATGLAGLLDKSRVILIADHLDYAKSVKLANNYNFQIEVIPSNFLNDLIFYSKREIVLIDDDKFMRMNWYNFFTKKNIKISCYESVDIFLANTGSHNLETQIFIDSVLSDKVRGELEAEKIYLRGFKNIFLATSFNEDEIFCPYWIRGVLSKDPEMVF